MHAISFTAAGLCCTLVIVLAHVLNRWLSRRGPWRPLSAADVCVVTGGASGLGAAIVAELHRTAPGITVVVLDVEPSPTLPYIQCDVGDTASLVAALERIDNEYGHPTVVVNNAGIRHPFASLHSLAAPTVHRVFAVNTYAPLTAMRHVVPRAVRANARLCVVNVASVLGHVGPAGMGVYAAAKAALIQAHTSAAHEAVGPVRMVLVAPGQLDTAMFGNKTPSEVLAPVVPVEGLARRVVGAINTGERGVVAEPLYARWVPIMSVLPWSVGEVLRKWSCMDVQTDG